MFKLQFQKFFRSKTCRLGLGFILILGLISIVIGKQFLIDQEHAEDQVEKMQQQHIERTLDLHSDDLPLLLYYLKLAVVNKTNPIAGFSIGQKDVNPSIQRVSILTLEGQKHDANLGNPTRLVFGNLDLSFVIIFVFPLLIIAFTYNLYSEEEESGTWKLVKVMAKSKSLFLLYKLGVRVIVITFAYLFLVFTGGLIFKVPFDGLFLLFTIAGYLYLLFWFALCFCLTCLKRSSNTNAVSLLSVWILLSILLPAILNNYITTKHPVPEALTTIIKQRDGYHQKWDTNKKETMEAFYEDYPQFSTYGIPPEEGFNWSWYYAMQHLGDLESKKESQEMHQKVYLRDNISKDWGQLIPTIHSQLTFNNIASTGLINHMKFLDFLKIFHEKTRLYFYPKIFSEKTPSSVDWEQFKPEYFQQKNNISWTKTMVPLLFSVLIFSVLSYFLIRKV